MGEAPDHSDRINELYDSGRFADLRSYCDALLAADPRDMAALQNASLACLNLGSFEDALGYCERVLDGQPRDTYALKNKVYALENLRRYGEVLGCCDALLAAEPGDPWTLNSAGLALAELDRHAEAIERFEQSLGRDPRNTTALMNMALSLGRLGRTMESISCYDRALRADTALREAAAAPRRGVPLPGHGGRGVPGRPGCARPGDGQDHRRCPGQQLLGLPPVLPGGDEHVRGRRPPHRQPLQVGRAVGRPAGRRTRYGFFVIY